MRLTDRLSTKYLVFLGAVLLIAGIASYILWTFDQRITEDNSLLETVQVTLLLLAATFHLFRMRIHPEAVFDVPIRVLLAFLCLGFAMRELEIDKFGNPVVWEPVESLVRGITAAACLIYLFRSRSRLPLFWKHRWSVALAPVCVLTFAGGFFYIFSSPFDHKIFSISRGASQLVEEILELWACILLLASAMAPGTEQDDLRGADSIRGRK